MALNNVVKKLEKARTKVGLNDGETIVAGCVANPRGTVAAAAVGGAIGMAIKAKMNKNEPGPGGLADSYPGGRCILGLTSERLVVCKMSAMTGSPSELLVSFDRAQIQSIEMEKAKTAWPMLITFVDGSTVIAEGAKGSGADDFADAVATLVG